MLFIQEAGVEPSLPEMTREPILAVEIEGVKPAGVPHNEC
jgi:hypothetical protein